MNSASSVANLYAKIRNQVEDKYDQGIRALLLEVQTQLLTVKDKLIASIIDNLDDHQMIKNLIVVYKANLGDIHDRHAKAYKKLGGERSDQLAQLHTQETTTMNTVIEMLKKNKN